MEAGYPKRSGFRAGRTPSPATCRRARAVAILAESGCSRLTFDITSVWSLLHDCRKCFKLKPQRALRMRGAREDETNGYHLSLSLDAAQSWLRLDQVRVQNIQHPMLNIQLPNGKTLFL